MISNNDAVCNNLTLNGGSLSLSGGNNLNVSGNLSIASGATFTVNSNLDTVFLTGSWSNDGTYLHGNSIVVFQGDNVQNLTSGGTSSGKRFFEYWVDKGATAQLSLTDDDLRIDHDLTITSGELVSGSRTITLGGDWNNTGGSFNYGTGTVSMFGGESDVIQSNGSYFYNLTLNNSGGDIQAQDDIRVLNDLLITAGTFYVNANEVAVGNAAGDRISVQGILDVNANAIVKVQGGSNGISVETGGQFNAIGTSAAALQKLHAMELQDFIQ